MDRAGRAHVGRSRAALLHHVREVRRDDRGRFVPVRGTRGRLERRTACRRRRADARCRRHRVVRVAERATRRCTGSASRRTRSGCASPSSASTTVPVRQAFERHGADRRRVRAGRGRHAAVPLRADPDHAARRHEPAIDGGAAAVRDVTELRKRDRLLLSKDATIREIHHRVKNNLQTISSLLRLQSRRLTNVEAKAAVQDSVRRIRTIALVHESLSREPGDDIAFIEIVRPLLRLAEEGLQSPDRPVRFSVSGDGGRIPARIATPLSVVLTELLQNAVDHGFPEGGRGGEVVVLLANDDEQARHPGHRQRSRRRSRLRSRRRDRPRSVDRANAGDDGAERPDLDPLRESGRSRVSGPRRRPEFPSRHRDQVERSDRRLNERKISRRGWHVRPRRDGDE